MGAEIVISGKLRTQRSRYEKFRDGILIKSGEPAERLVKTATYPLLVKQGIIGIKVSILPPGPEYEEFVEMERKERARRKKSKGEKVEKEEEEGAEEEVGEAEAS